MVQEIKSGAVRMFESTALILAILVCSTVASPSHAQTPAPLAHPDLGLRVEGIVNAIAFQPDGGMIFGGGFSSVNGVARQNIARRLPDGTLDLDWKPAVHGAVQHLVSDDSGSIFVAGSFNYIGDAQRTRIAKLEGTGAGSVDPTWQVSIVDTASGFPPISAMVITPTGSLYIGGTFSAVGGTTCFGLAWVSATTGTLEGCWNGTGGQVEALAAAPDGSIYVGGYIYVIDGQHRYGLAKLSGDGLATLDAIWNPNGDGIVFALTVDASGTVYAAGNFSNIGGQSRGGLAKLSGSGSGLADPNWNPGVDSQVGSLVVDATGSVYVGGYFNHVGGLPRAGLAKLSGSGSGGADPSWNPDPDSRARALAVDSQGKLHVGGAFTWIGNQQHLGLTSLDALGTPIDSLDAELDNTVVVADMEFQSDGRLILAGNFLKAGGLPRRNLARLLVDGNVDPDWKPSTNGPVNAVAIDSDGGIFIGGSFTQVERQPRGRLAKLSPDGGGNVDPDWTPAASFTVKDLATGGADSIYVSGDFTSISGVNRPQLAKLSRNGVGSVDAAWNPAPNDAVYGLSRGIDGMIYVGGSFQNIAGRQRPWVARLAPDGIGELDVGWNPSPNYPVATFAFADDGTAYLGGQFNQMGGLDRSAIAKLNRDGSVLAGWQGPSISSANARSIAIDGRGYVFLGGAIGSFYYGTGTLIPINHLFRLSAQTGAIDENWYPGSNGPQGVIKILVGGSENDSLYVGGAYSVLGVTPRAGFAVLPTSVVDAVFNNGFDSPP